MSVLSVPTYFCRFIFSASPPGRRHPASGGALDSGDSYHSSDACDCRELTSLIASYQAPN
eukprot:scaffold574481_cov29-Prasinocladus_malaysianus.AAC.2